MLRRRGGDRIRGVTFAGRGAKREKRGGREGETTTATTTTTGKENSFPSSQALLSSPLKLSLSPPPPHDVALFRYAIRSVRSWGFLSPANTILVPGEEKKFFVFVIFFRGKKTVSKEKRENGTKEKKKKNASSPFQNSTTHQGCTSSG